MIRESAANLEWRGILLEIGSSPEFHPTHVCTPYFYFALDVSPGLDWQVEQNGMLTKLHSSEGQIWVNPPWTPFTHAITEECHFHILAIEEERFFDAARITDTARRRKLQFLSQYNLDDAVLRHFIALFVEEMKSAGRNGPDYVSTLVEGFAKYYVGNYSDITDTESEAASTLCAEDLAVIRGHMLQNIGERITIDDLAAELGMSKFRFLREYKKLTGETPYQFLQKLRLAEAERLLMDARKDLTAIAHALGFYDHSHFANFFRKFKGMSPNAFRKRNFIQ